jgi:APA family basic amino acid/polyamine antiporter
VRVSFSFSRCQESSLRSKTLLHLDETVVIVAGFIVFVVFIIFGAEGALLSTLNSQLASATKPILQATWDGWFPASWGKLNKKKVPYIYLTVLFIIGAATAVTGMDIATITTLVQIIGSVNNVLLVYCMLNLPKVFPEAWAASKFHISSGLMMAAFIYGEATVLYALWVQLQGKAAWVYIGNVVMVVVALAYSLMRYNRGGIAKTPYKTILGETHE